MPGRMRSLLAILAAFGLVLSITSPAAASAGELDDTFDGNGKLLLNESAGDDFASDVAIQTADQKIVIAGGSHPTDGEWVVRRLNPDGSPDTGFGGGDGKATVDFSSREDYANAVALQADGSIVVVGLAGDGSGGRWGIAMFTNAGVLDSSFSGDGKATLDFTTGQDVATDVAITSDQKILVTGYSALADSRFMVVRLLDTGPVDGAFGNGGLAQANLSGGQDLALSLGQFSNGRIVLGGYVSGSGGQMGLARFSAAGNLDSGFSGDGKLTRNLTSRQDYVTGVAVQQSDNKIALSAAMDGNGNGKFAAFRYNPDGTPDTTFSGDGWTTINVTEFSDTANSVAIQGDGSIVLGGHANFGFFTIVRLTSAGTRDTSFGDDGVMFSNLTDKYDVVFSVAIQADGAIVAAGTSAGQGGRISIARFLGS